MWVWYARLPIHPTTCQLLYFPQNICVFLCLYLRCVSVCHMPDIHQPASDFSLWNFRLNLSVYLQQQLLQYLLKWNFVSKILQCHGQSVNLPLDFQKPLFFLNLCLYIFVWPWFLHYNLYVILKSNHLYHVRVSLRTCVCICVWLSVWIFIYVRILIQFQI